MTMIKLVDMRVHGVSSAKLTTWVRQFGGTLREFPEAVAGFVR